MLATDSVFDLILRHGTIIDGTGSAACQADVGIRGERLEEVGDLRNARARREIDVSGLVVSPGFIDVHTHDDAVLIARPAMTPKVTQGVTTVIAGNCGISGAPYTSKEDPGDLLRLVFKSAHFVAPTFKEYVQKVIDAAPAVNAAFLTGHTTLRLQVMGEDLDRPASKFEIARMRDLLRQCLEAGSLGLSTGLFYPPARAASTREVIEVAQPLRDYQGIYVTHVRDEADGVEESLRESLEIGREAGVHVNISHHKCMGRRNFGRSVQTLALLHEARRRQSVALDVYPYIAASTVLNEEFVGKSERTLIAWCDPYPEYSGRLLAEVAQELGCSEVNAVQKLLPAGAVYFLMDETDVTRIIGAPNTMIGSDGLPEDKHPHPRLWGTFPRVLGRYVRERRVLSLEDAVHRMTGLSARQFGLDHRGQIKAGYFADLCVFDPDTVLDMATFEKPMQPARGVHHVFVNGRSVLENGIQTSARPGAVLKRSGMSPLQSR